MIKLVIKSILFTLLMPGVVAVMIPLLMTNGLSINDGILYFLAIFLMLVGAVIYSWCVKEFILSGLGTPAPVDAPKKLVTSGLYQYSRNPMYLSVFCLLSGWVLLFPHGYLLLYGLCVFLSIGMLVVFYEEPVLLQLFAHDYVEYKKCVNRWFPNNWLK